MSQLFRGHLFHLRGNPSLLEANSALEEIEDALVLVDDDGLIKRYGAFDELRAQHPNLGITGSPRHYLLPGFIDTHIHFPQVFARTSWGGGELLEWLDKCIFPAEAALQDAAHAGLAAEVFTSELARAGTTCAMVFGSEFPKAQTELFSAFQRKGLRGIIGRTTMVKGPPSASPLCTSTDEALRLCREEIERWHPKSVGGDRSLLAVALVPRFPLSLDRETFKALGDLYAEVKDQGVYFSSHLSENNRPHDGEVPVVLKEFGIRSYLDAFDGRFMPGSAKGGESFLGPRSILAHAVHCSPEEHARLAASKTGVAHCPSSQQFLGSGTMPLRKLADAGVRIGLGSDIGAGDQFSIAQVANTCFKVHMSATPPHATTPAELLHLSTLGGAQALDLADRVGNFAPGKEADLLLFDPERSPLLKQTLEAVRGEAALFALLLGHDSRSLIATVVQGNTVFRADPVATSE